MISAVDLLCIVITVVLIAIEGQRGLLLSLVDLATVMAALVGAGLCYERFVRLTGSYSSAYLTCLIVLLLVAVGLGIFLSRRTRENVRPWEATAGAFVGLLAGGLISYGIYQFLVMRYGSSSLLLRNSLLGYQFDERGLVYDLSEFVRTFMGRR